ncbi:hypothetical protein NPIL_59071, partial [Nephila pilipes]
MDTQLNGSIKARNASREFETIDYHDFMCKE